MTSLGAKDSRSMNIDRSSRNDFSHLLSHQIPVKRLFVIRKRVSPRSSCGGVKRVEVWKRVGV